MPGGVQPLTLLSTIFDSLGTPFVYLPLTNGTPYPLHTSKCNFIKSMNKSENQEFSRPFHCYKILLLALLGLFTDRNDRIPCAFICFN